MSPKPNTPVPAPIVPHCQHISARGYRCRMLTAKNHSSLCPFHLAKSQAQGSAPDPQAVAAELLDGIDSFGTADEVNLFLGNLVKQFARKRIGRRDALALGYLSQLLLNTLPAMEREYEAEKYAAGSRDLIDGFIQSQKARLAQQQSTESGTAGGNPS